MSYFRALEAACWGVDMLSLAQPSATLEEIKAEVHRAIDTYAPYGSYIFFGFSLVDSEDPKEIMKAMMPIFEEAGKYGRTFYNKVG